MFDSHVHTSFSCDSDMLIEDAIKKCRELDMGIVITDHMDINPFRGSEFTFNVDDFFKLYEKHRSEDILMGIELGFRVEAVNENAEIVDGYNFDFILGSTHAPYSMETALEYYDKEYYEGLSKAEAYREYFASMLRGIRENTYFDSLAHIDYIARYSPYDDPEVHYEEFSGEIDAVLSELVLQNKSMEISTRRIGNPSVRKALLNIYKRFAELGGETVTIGSDGHATNVIGRDFKLALNVAAETGLRPVYYKNRQRVFL